MPWTTADIGDQQGRTFVVTGANTGIGLETAAGLAAAGATVVMACRSTDKAEAARERIEARDPKGILEILRLDLADQRQIADAAVEAIERFPRIDALVNNAGVMALPLSYTPDGHEMVFGTNHLGHFAFTGRVLSALQAAPRARVICVSSLSHKLGRIAWDDLRGERRYRKSRAYAQSKLANLLFAFGLQRRLVLAGYTTISLGAHPGTVATEIGRDRSDTDSFRNRIRESGPSLWFQERMGGESGGPLAQSAADGALPSLRAATDPGAYGGQYYGPSSRGGARGAPVAVPPGKRALNEVDQDRLWKLSEELTGFSYPF